MDWDILGMYTKKYNTVYSELFVSFPGKCDECMGRFQSGTRSAPMQNGFHNIAVPVGLLSDARLTPLERNAWLALHWLLASGKTPTYEQLRPYLCGVACEGKASHETVARCMAVLRLTGWVGVEDGALTLLTEARNPAVLATEESYWQLCQRACAHASQSVRRVAQHVVREVCDALSPEQLHYPFHTLLDTTLPDFQCTPECGRSRHCSRFHVSEVPADEVSEVPANPLLNSQMEECLPVRTGSSSCSTTTFTTTTSTSSGVVNNTTTTTVPTGSEALHWPPRLPAGQRPSVWQQLRRIEAKMRQAVLDEWAVRSASPQVRNPLAYLFGLIRRAAQGLFNATVAPQDLPVPQGVQTEPQSMPAALQSTSVHPASTVPSPAPVPSNPTAPEPKKPTTDTPASHERAREHLARIRNILKTGSPTADAGKSAANQARPLVHHLRHAIPLIPETFHP